jgi:hypothetical protein
MSGRTYYDVIDDDTMATADSDNIATSESVKAYVDATAAGIRTISADGTAGIVISGDMSASGISITGDTPTGITVTGTCATAAIVVGANTAPAGDVVFYGLTTGKKVTWDSSADMLDVDGIMKVHNRPVSTDTYALEVKCDYDQATGVGQGGFQCSTRVYPATDTTAVLARGGYFQCQLHADDTMTGGGMTGLYTQVHNNDTGILNGSGIIVRSLHTDIADGGTWTEVSRVCSLHVDSNLAQTVTAGTYNLLFIQNSGTTTAADAIAVDGNDKISALMTLTNVDGAAMTANGSVLADISSTANDGYIKVVVEGEDKYIALYDLKSS